MMPMVTETSVATPATISDICVPCMMRASMSRPFWSVPAKWPLAKSGGLRIELQSTLS